MVAIPRLKRHCGKGVSIRHLAPAGSLAAETGKILCHRSNPVGALRNAGTQGACDANRETSCHVCQG
jgi:hypothetical protein